MFSGLRNFFSSLPLSKNSLALIGLFVILAAIPLTVFLSQQQQEIRQRAAVACKQPIASLPQIDPSCLPLPAGCTSASYHWVLMDNPVDAAKYGVNNACGGVDALAANAVCPKNTSDPSNVNPDTSNWCYEFTEGNRCIQLQHIPGSPSCGGVGGNCSATVEAARQQLIQAGGPFQNSSCTEIINKVCSDCTVFVPPNSIRDALCPGTCGSAPTSYKVAGKVMDINGSAIAGLTVEVWNDKGSKQSTVTDGSGQFSVESFIKTGDVYAIRIPRQQKAPDPSLVKTTTQGWTWRIIGGDTPLGSQSYELQKAGENDCAGLDNASVRGRCNFSVSVAQVGGTIRPTYCEKTTADKTSLSSGNITITSTAKIPLKKFMFAFYNTDNQGVGGPKPIFYEGSQHFTPTTELTTAQTQAPKTFTHQELARPDNNWGGNIPSRIQVNGYFIDDFGNQSAADPNCVATFALILPTTPTPTPTLPPGVTPTPTPTPIPTVTPGVTPTPTATPTPSPMSLAFNLTIPGIRETSSPRRPTRQATVTMFTGDNQPVNLTNRNLNLNFQIGVFRGALDLRTSLSPGNYIIFIKETNSLSKRLGRTVNLLAGVNTLPQTEITYGDINGDDFFNIFDYNILVGCFGPKMKLCGDQGPLTDMDDDGDVDIFDFNLLQSAFLKQKGDLKLFIP